MALLTAPHLLEGHRWKNQRVGLLGGSFNPPHKGHVHISQAALKGLHLDCVWWLVTPQNPLKDQAPLPLKQRIALSKALITDPNILVTGLEAQLHTSITYQTIKKLKKHFPTTEFVWISGMDNAQSLHRWHHWKDLLSEVCMLHLTRSPAKSLVRSCPLRMYAPQNHVRINRSGRMPLTPGTTYWMMQKKMVNISSTQLREKLGQNAEI